MAFEIPADISALSDDALEAAISGAQDEARKFDDIPNEDFSAEQVDEILALSEFVGAARATQRERAERAASLAAAREALAVEPEEAPEPEEAAAPETPAVEMSAEQEDDSQEEDPEPSTDEVDPPVEAAAETEPDTEAIVASAGRSALSRAAENTPEQEAPRGPRAALTAAADVPNVPSTKTLDFAEAGEIVMNRLRAYPQDGGSRSKTQIKNTAVQVSLAEPEVHQRDFGHDDDAMFAAAAKARQKRAQELIDDLRNGKKAIVAAGDWGAPSETLYDLCTEGTSEGIITLPEVGISRGGVKYTKGPSFQDIFNLANGYIDQTEAQAAAGTPKTAMVPSNPSFTDVRLEAVGVNIQAGLLTRVGYPELVQRYVQGALLAHPHKVAAKVIGKIEAFTGAAHTIANGFGSVMDLVHGLALVIDTERQQSRASLSQVYEVKLPFWIRSVLRAEASQRTGIDVRNGPLLDAEIQSWFTTAGAIVEYLYNWQPITVGGTTAGYADAYPQTVQALIYLAGTYVKGTSPIISLNTMYDSTLLEENSYTELFTEEGILVANPCNTGRRISVAIPANGITAASATTGNLFVA